MHTCAQLCLRNHEERDGGRGWREGREEGKVGGSFIITVTGENMRENRARRGRGGMEGVKEGKE